MMSNDPDVPAAPQTRFPRSIHLLDWPNILIVLTLAVFVASFVVRNSDFWLHLAAGRLIAAGEYPFGLDPFSALEPAPAWINHAWLFDLLAYLLDRAAGGAAVVIAKAIAIALLAVTLLTIRRRGSDLWWPIILTAIALLAMTPRLMMQPAIISYLATGLLMRILLQPTTSQKSWMQPLSVAILFALWVNLDGGFWIGLMLLALTALGSLLQRMIPLGSSDPESPGDPLAAILLLAAGAAGCLINPYGLAVFSMPSDWAFLTLPENLRNDFLFRPLFRRPIDGDYSSTYAGLIPGAAYFLLLGLGLGSFILNTGGWRWNRLLFWVAAVMGSLWLARLAPYFAIVGAPITVMNVQSFLARRTVRARDARAEFAQRFAGGFARVLTLFVGIGLLALAWAGRLAPDGNTAQQNRRVGWALAPDESAVRAAQQLRTWHDAGHLRGPDARGFHLPLELGYICAWYCPSEKMTFDLRMTNPSAATTVVALRESMRKMRERPDAAPEPPRGFSHLVFTGSNAMELSRGVFYRADRFPLWAIVGQGWITGWVGSGATDPRPSLRLDPVRLAASPAPSSGLSEYPELPPISAWERYRAAPRPVPPDAFESALWLNAREAAVARLEPVVAASQIAAGIGRSAPAGPSDIANRLWDATVVSSQLRNYVEPSWHRSPDGRLARVAPLMAIRAARRAIRTNPDDYEAFLRLVTAYAVVDSDQELARVPLRASFNQLQQITAARQALDRIPIAASYGQFVAADEQILNSALRQQYEQSTVTEALNVRPLDLILEASNRMIELSPVLIARQAAIVAAEQRPAFVKAADEALKKDQERVEALRREVQRRSDDYENRAAKVSAFDRARIAAAFGLPREALTVLRNSDTTEMTFPGVDLMLNLMVLAGQADQTSIVLQSKSFHPVTVLRPEQQPPIRALNLRTSVALGDLAPAIEALNPSIQNGPMSVMPMLAGALQNLVFADLGASPFTRAATTVSWGGLWANPQQALWQGDLLALQITAQAYGDLIVQQGLLALEQGDAPLARRRFQQALDTMGRLAFPLRDQAARWLDLLTAGQ